jgi:hypothetical protein
MTDAREITVEEIDEFEWWVCQIYAKSKRAKAICALARRALSQEGGEQVRGCFCHTCGQIMPNTIVTPIPDTPQSVPAWELVPCMDDWCKISPCKCRDGINALIAERDRLKSELELADKANYEHSEFNRKLEAERDKLKAEATCFFDEGIRLAAERDKLKEEKEEFEVWSEQQRAKLVKRVSVLEGALEEITRECDALNKGPVAVKIARAALRTSEDV